MRESLRLDLLDLEARGAPQDAIAAWRELLRVDPFHLAAHQALGRLLGGPVKLYVYPLHDPKTGETVTAETFTIPAHLSHLYAHLRKNERVVSITPQHGFDLAVLPRDVLAMIRNGKDSWEAHVPEVVARVIKERRLFGYGGAALSR